jgi:hypothetical protein
VMTDMLQLSRRTDIMPERDIVKYIRSAIAIDGVNLRFEPDFHVGRHLEEECGRFLQWQAVRGALSQDTVLAWSGLGTRLVTETPAQAGLLLDRLTSGEMTVRAQIRGGACAEGERRSRALNLSVAVLTLSVLMALTGQPVAIGWNLFTVETALILVGLGMLLPALGRLV